MSRLSALLLCGLLAAAPALASGGGRSYHARIGHGSGRFSDAIGTATVRARGSSAQLSLSVRGAHCPASRRGCLTLSGTLTGTATPKRTAADTGSSYRITASGRIRGLGLVHAAGVARGTGFIRSGRCTLSLKLTARRGSVTLTGASRPVGGFSSPL